MKLLFSEYDPDYSRYLYPYVVWAVREAHETPADLYAAGFHPVTPDLDRFTLCRQLRLPLPGFRASSENRRLLRKADGLRLELQPRAAFEYTTVRREAWLDFAHQRFGAGIMTGDRLDALLGGRVITHALLCRDSALGDREVGVALMYLEPPRMAHYYYAFYDLKHANRSLGLSLMTLAVRYFQESGIGHLYLGTCYSERALYKVQFEGLEVSQGMGWSPRTESLRWQIRRDARARHLLQEPEFLALHGGLDALVERTPYRTRVLHPPP